jgi:chromosome segregation ATPase
MAEEVIEHLRQLILEKDGINVESLEHARILLTELKPQIDQRDIEIDETRDKFEQVHLDYCDGQYSSDIIKKQLPALFERIRELEMKHSHSSSLNRKLESAGDDFEAFAITIQTEPKELTNLKEKVRLLCIEDQRLWEKIDRDDIEANALYDQLLSEEKLVQQLKARFNRIQRLHERLQNQDLYSHGSFDNWLDHITRTKPTYELFEPYHSFARRKSSY